MTDEPIDLPPDESPDAPEEFPETFSEEHREDSVDELTDESPAADPTSDAPVAVEAKSRPAVHVLWGTRTRVAVASLAFVAMMFLFVFPTRSYLAQRHQVGQARDAVSVLNAQNKVLARQAKLLETPAEIQRLARQQFNLVMPGETAYNVVPDPTDSKSATTTTVP